MELFHFTLIARLTAHISVHPPFASSPISNRNDKTSTVVSDLQSLRQQNTYLAPVVPSKALKIPRLMLQRRTTNRLHSVPNHTTVKIQQAPTADHRERQQTSPQIAPLVHREPRGVLRQRGQVNQVCLSQESHRAQRYLHR